MGATTSRPLLASAEDAYQRLYERCMRILATHPSDIM